MLLALNVSALLSIIGNSVQAHDSQPDANHARNSRNSESWYLTVLPSSITRTTGTCSLSPAYQPASRYLDFITSIIPHYQPILSPAWHSAALSGSFGSTSSGASHYMLPALHKKASTRKHGHRITGITGHPQLSINICFRTRLGEARAMQLWPHDTASHLDHRSGTGDARA
ncbi:hypothetical protein B0H67DRAFT_56179 [Lasiosphaeris hirsuta]|uniref:Secreted protein n=1 Tax=Lasiosphaeris hirsuta TaxID=260670 RepID=A0AA40EAD2_9PEZI|nr:hypothetical protein B0H67DRAFT_56179 [Lasiosphaeris hirsuta]